MKEVDYIKQMLGINDLTNDTFKYMDLENECGPSTIQTYRCILIKMQSMYDDLLTKYREAIEEKAILEYKLNSGKK